MTRLERFLWSWRAKARASSRETGGFGVMPAHARLLQVVMTLAMTLTHCSRALQSSGGGGGALRGFLF